MCFVEGCSGAVGRKPNPPALSLQGRQILEGFTLPFLLSRLSFKGLGAHISGEDASTEILAVTGFTSTHGVL